MVAPRADVRKICRIAVNPEFIFDLLGLKDCVYEYAYIEHATGWIVMVISNNDFPPVHAGDVIPFKKLVYYLDAPTTIE